MAGIASSLYNTIFRKNPVFLAAVFTSAFAFEIAFDRTIEKYWDTRNKGRQWKDIRHKYVEAED
ncbi:qcr9 subunit 9 of the ubiquinol cytochrome-c reductase complex [Varicellaria rhodocarpa]|nr:qcr9 subunit 9 of the ubiquinol cytochrome-c reductase complex [Varicellaria rhodocarpa]